MEDHFVDERPNLWHCRVSAWIGLSFLQMGQCTQVVTPETDKKKPLNLLPKFLKYLSPKHSLLENFFCQATRTSAEVSECDPPSLNTEKAPNAIPICFQYTKMKTLETCQSKWMTKKGQKWFKLFPKCSNFTWRRVNCNECMSKWHLSALIKA